MADQLIPRGTPVQTSRPEQPTTGQSLTPRGTPAGGAVSTSAQSAQAGPKGYLNDPELDRRAFEEAQRRLAARPQGRFGQALDLVDRAADNYAFNLSRPFSGLRESLPGGGGFQYGKAIDRYYDEGIQEAAGLAGTGAEIVGSLASPSPLGKAKLAYQAGEGAVVSGLESLAQSTETDNAGRDATISALTGGTVAGAVGSIGRSARPLEETDIVGTGETVEGLLGGARNRLGVEGLNRETAGLDLREALITDLVGRAGGRKGMARNLKSLSTGIPNLKKIIEEDSIPGSVIADEIMNLGSRAGKRNAARAAANIVDTLGNDAAALASLRAGMLQNVLGGPNANPAQSMQRIQRFMDDNTELVNQLFTPEQADALAELNVMMRNAIQPNTPQADKFGELLQTVLGPEVGAAIRPLLKARGGAAALVTGAGGVAAGIDPTTAIATGILAPYALGVATKALSSRPARQAISFAASRPVGAGRLAAEAAIPAFVGGEPEPNEEDLKRYLQQQMLQGGQ